VTALEQCKPGGVAGAESARGSADPGLTPYAGHNLPQLGHAAKKLMRRRAHTRLGSCAGLGG
jgi:hypothetical protein